MKSQKALHIGFDAKRAFFNKSGLGNYSRDLIRILETFAPKNRYSLYKHRDKKGIDFNLGKQSKIILPDSKFYKRFGTIWRSAGISKQLKKGDLDVFHGLSHELPLGIETSNVKTVVTMHDCIFLRYPELYDVSFRVIFKKKYAHACRVADRIIAISEQTKKDVIHYFNVPEDKIDVVYQGCNPIFYKDATEEEKQLIRQKYGLPDEFMLYVGTIEDRKNVLSVFKAMVQGNINVPLVVVGRPTKYLETVTQFVLENKLSNKAIFLHTVETHELPAFYQSARLFVYPSLFEGFGIPILEALNSSTPVVTSKGSCFPEVGGEAAQYVEYGNIAELASTLLKVLQDTELSHQMILKGKEQALKFREKKIADDMMAVYYKTLNI